MFWDKKEPKKEKVNVKSATFELVATTAQGIGKYTITSKGRAYYDIFSKVIAFEDAESRLIYKLNSSYCSYIKTDDGTIVNKSMITSFRKIEEKDYFVEVTL